MKKYIFLMTLFWASPLMAANVGDVIVNEIMWMGTAASTSDEWIELYNPTTSDIDLTNWTLKSEDGTPQIILTGIIPAQGYYLLERTDDNTIKDISADKIYTGALGDTGESLVLRDSFNVVIDSVPCAGCWFAGKKSPNYSMERINPKENGWLQANWGSNNGVTINGLDANSQPVFATPKAQNGIYYDGSSSDEPDNPPQEYKIQITEVSFASSVDWVELYNYGTEPVDISNFMLTDLDGTDSRLANQPVMLPPGKYAVVWWDENGLDETDDIGDANSNGFIDLYVPDTSLSATDDQVVLMSASSDGQYIDAVCWSNVSGDFSPGENNDINLLVTNSQWQIIGTEPTESDCWINSAEVGSNKSIGRLSLLVPDTNSKNDWYLFPVPTLGADNADIIPPQAVNDLTATIGINAGEINISWTASGDDGNNGTANSYILKYSTQPINSEDDFNKANLYPQSWVPLEANEKENYVLTGLALDTTYYFVLKVKDEEDNFSEISNQTSAVSQKDITPPKMNIEISPLPPLKCGWVEITLNVKDISLIAQTPELFLIFSDSQTLSLSLTGEDKKWHTKFFIESTTTNGIAEFKVKVVDTWGNIGEEINTGESFVIDTSIKTQEGGSCSNNDGTEIILPPAVSDENLQIEITKPTFINLENYNFGNEIIPLSETLRNFVATNILNGEKIRTFKNKVQIKIPYPTETQNEDNLKLFYLDQDENSWQMVTSSQVNKDTDFVIAELEFLAIFCIMRYMPPPPTPPPITPTAVITDLEKTFISPNPCYLNQGQALKVKNLPSTEQVTIAIYNLNGELIWDGATDTGELTWHGENGTGQRISSGIYLCLIKSSGQLKVLKFALVR